MKKLLTIILLVFVGFGLTAETVRIKNKKPYLIVYKADFVDPEIVKCIVNIADTMYNECLERDLSKIANFRKDNKTNNDLEANRMACVSLSSVSYEYLIVVNNEYGEKSSAFTIYPYIGESLPTTIIDGERYSINRVRKYGYMEILGYKILLVDDAFGREYFTINENEPIKTSLFYRSFEDNILTKTFGSFLYREVDGKWILDCRVYRLS